MDKCDTPQREQSLPKTAGENNEPPSVSGVSANSNTHEIYPDDFASFFQSQMYPNNRQGKKGRLHSITEVRRILEGLRQYTKEVEPEQCRRLFQDSQNKTNRKTATGPDVRSDAKEIHVEQPGKYNWNRVMQLANIQGIRAQQLPSTMGLICAPETSNPAIKQGRALAYLIKHIYLARGKVLSNFEEEEKMAKAFVDNHWKEFTSPRKVDASNARLVNRRLVPESASENTTSATMFDFDTPWWPEKDLNDGAEGGYVPGNLTLLDDLITDSDGSNDPGTFTSLDELITVTDSASFPEDLDLAVEVVAAMSSKAQADTNMTVEQNDYQNLCKKIQKYERIIEDIAPTLQELEKQMIECANEHPKCEMEIQKWMNVAQEANKCTHIPDIDEEKYKEDIQSGQELSHNSIEKMSKLRLETQKLREEIKNNQRKKETHEKNLQIFKNRKMYSERKIQEYEKTIGTADTYINYHKHLISFALKGIHKLPGSHVTLVEVPSYVSARKYVLCKVKEGNMTNAAKQRKRKSEKTEKRGLSTGACNSAKIRKAENKQCSSSFGNDLSQGAGIEGQDANSLGKLLELINWKCAILSN